MSVGTFEAHTEVHGFCDPQFFAVREAIRNQIAAGEEVGVSLFVDLEGRTLIDLWAGWRDPSREHPWTRDTIVNTWSTTKMVTNLAALVLIDRGHLDPFAPVASYWPEFAANGKENIEVRHVLSHTSGVSGWEAPFTIEEVYDREVATAHLAAQTGWWEPGTASGYQATNHGHLVGELIRRVDGRTLTQFVAEEIAHPLSADFQIGAAPADWGRVATVITPPPVSFELDPSSVAGKSLTSPPIDPAYCNTEAWRRAEIGASNGHGNARSVGQIMRALSLGGALGARRLISQETIDLIFTEQVHGEDLVLGIPLRWGIGYALPETVTVPYVRGDGAFYWGGWGGSLTVVDVDRRLTFSYVMNKMAPGIIGSSNAQLYADALEAALR